MTQTNKEDVKILHEKSAPLDREYLYRDAYNKEFRENISKIRFEIEDILKKFVAYLEENLHLNQRIFKNIESRIKEDDSFIEKIKRKNYINEWPIGKEKSNIQDTICRNLPDLIGYRINCFFSDDEKKIYDELKKYYNDNKMQDIYLNFQENIKQKNGHIIYKVTGKYKNKYNFEIQIKSLFHNVWGEVEHKTIYKNQQYDFSNSIKKSITEEIFNLLKASNNQLYSIINFKYEKIELIKALFFEETHEKIFKQNNTHILGKHYTNFFAFLANEEDLINFVSKSLINEQVDRKVVTYKLDNSIEKLAKKIKYKYLSYDFEILKDIFDIIYILKKDTQEEFYNFFAYKILKKYHQIDDEEEMGNFIEEQEEIEEEQKSNIFDDIIKIMEDNFEKRDEAWKK